MRVLRALRPLAALAAAVAITSTVTVAAPAAADTEPVRYRPPVDAEITDPFRAPATQWGAGNRGVDYATEPGTVVRSAAPGTVVFAGAVGAARHVVVLHADGLRTTYAFLAELAVRRGEIVEAATPVGRTAGRLHFGVRAGDRYLDPLSVLAGGPPQVELIPLDPLPLSPAAERDGLVRSLGARLWAGLGAAGRGGVAAAGWAVDQGAAAWLVLHQIPEVAVQLLAAELAATAEDIRLWLRAVAELEPSQRLGRVFERMRRWAAARRWCTPAAEPPPPLPERRIAVLVGGLGAGSGAATILDVDPVGLGYAPADVALFSYRGGAVPGIGGLGLSGEAYEADDTTQDLHLSAARLRGLLEQIRQRHPGVPVDVLAHSQGGVVTRLALDGDDHRDPLLPPIRTIVTLASPHQGADVAGGVALLGTSTVGALAVAVLDRHGPARHSVGPSLSQLVEGSPVMTELADRGLPAGAQVTSIAAVGDPVVTAPNTELDGADHASVRLVGVDAHTDLVRSPATRREVALAVAGLRPTCVPFGRALTDAVAGETVSYITDAAGVGLALVANRVPPAAPDR